VFQPWEKEKSGADSPTFNSIFAFEKIPEKIKIITIFGK
jgi:hypothetical protein